MNSSRLTTREKARRLNLETNCYGSFAEIGAGQEVAAFFFKAGGASQTIAKTMSAYDMTFSNAIYGAEESGRYVVESRLMKMISKEYSLLEQRLGIKMGFDTRFFAFANTVTTINFQKTNQGHGWIGVRFQLKPQTPPNDIVIHIKLHDRDALDQQHALGIVGVNLIYGAYYYPDDTEKMLLSLMDGLSSERIEVDMMRLSGPDFAQVDNRIVSLQLVNNGLTNAAIFGPDGDVIQPADLLYKKNILALRGRFRPLTWVNLDMLRRGYEQFIQEEDVRKDRIEILAELTVNDLRLGSQEIDYQDFLDRVDILSSLGCTVMISNYQEYYRLVSYFSQFTKEKIGIVLGIYALQLIFDEKYYEHLTGGILESFSTLFSRNVKLYVYPAHHRNGNGEMYNCRNFELPENQIDLYQYLLANDKIENIKNFDANHLHIISDNVLKMIKNCEKGWEELVPDTVVQAIKKKCLFGYEDKGENLPEKPAAALAAENIWNQVKSGHEEG
ncbi:MAG: TonB-dependent receptor [Microscillaceae bacterium]|nr:TonB-dependent receptor [Microscillaceae bacterium]